MSITTFKQYIASLLPDNSAVRITKHREANEAMVDMFWLPEGIPFPFTGSVIPSGWHLFNGAAISRTENPALFALWGTTHGVGDGSTTFNVPNWPQGTSPVQAGANFALGAKGGSKDHTLTKEELPAINAIGEVNQTVVNPGGIGAIKKSKTGDGNVTVYAPDSSGLGSEPDVLHIYPFPNIGSGTPFSVMGPWVGVNWIFQLK